MKSFPAIVVASFWILTGAFPILGQTVRKEAFQGRDAVSGEIIVRFKPSAAALGQTIAAQDSDIVSSEQAGRSGAVLLRSRGRNTAELIQAFAGRGDVEYAEPNYVWRKSDFPNDPLFGQQWALQNTGQTINGQTGIVNADIHAVQAWNSTVGSHGIVVGVVDTGIDYTHPDLISNLWTGPASGFIVTINGQSIHCGPGVHGFNALTRTCDPLDDEGHGTAVSGVIGAAGSNGIGVAGISRISTIMALKFLDSSGSGTTTDAIAAIEFAIQVKTQLGVNLRVLNASWGGTGFSQALLDEINLANSNDMLFVASAGNSGANTDINPEYPTSYNAPNLISVAATDNRDGIWSTSNYGATTVNIGAPGVNIESTLRGGSYGFNTGTSLAAPMVSGAAALVLASCPMTTSALRSLLLVTVNQIPSLAGEVTSGGRLNVAQAIGACTGTGSGTFNLASDSGPHITGAGSSITVVITITPINGFTGAVNLTASNLPSFVTATFSPASVSGSGSSVMTLNVGPNTFPSASSVRVTGTGGGVTQVISVPFVVVPHLSMGQSINGNLDTDDPHSVERPGAFADFYQLDLISSASVTIDMRSTAFDSFLYLLSPSGTVLNSDNDSGGGVQPRMGPVLLSPGTYMIEATSLNVGSIGSYFISFNTPTLDTIAPASGQAGTTFNVTLAGNRFSAPAGIIGANFPVTNIAVVDSQTITATFTLGQSVTTGIRSINVTSPEGGSNPIPFTVTPAAPTLTSITPSLGVPGTIASIRLSGFGFVPGMTVDAGDGITVNLFTNSDTAATMTFTISAGASVGVHNVTFTTPSGTSNAVPFILTTQAPILISFNPPTGTVGRSANISVSGANFVAPLTFDSGSGLHFETMTILSPTQATVSVSVDFDAALGPRSVTARTPAGVSNALVFTVNPVFANLTKISPDHVGQGSTIDVTLTGSGFSAPMTVDAGSDVAVSNVILQGSFSARATLAISGAAAAGVRNVTVTTLAGTSNPVGLTVLAPFPDLAVSDSHAKQFGVGFYEDFNVVVRNLGSVPTSEPTTATINISSLTIVSIVGGGWSCSAVSKSVSICTHSGAIAAGAESSITVTIAVDQTISGTSAIIDVSTASDTDNVNNRVVESVSIVPIPFVGFGSSKQLQSGIQVDGGLAVSPPFPHPLSGTMKLSFVPGGSVPVDDPAIQFSTGGRQVDFIIPANSSSAQTLENTGIAFQTGTVAGTLTLSGTVQALPAGIFPPPVISSRVVEITPQAPVILNVAKDTQTGLATLVTLFSNTRELTSVSFAFNTTPGVKLSCGSVSGCSTDGATVTFDAQSLFNDWYASDVTYGGANTLRVPLAIDGTLTGTVNVTVRNSRGLSNTSSFSLP